MCVCVRERVRVKQRERERERERERQRERAREREREGLRLSHLTLVVERGGDIYIQHVYSHVYAQTEREKG